MPLAACGGSSPFAKPSLYKLPGYSRRRVLEILPRPAAFWGRRSNLVERVGSKLAHNQGEEQELEYTQLRKRLQMLEFLRRALGESQDRGDLGVVLEFHNPPPTEEAESSYGTLPPYAEPPLLTAFGMRVDVSKELGIDNAEAVALLKDLKSEGCLQLDFISRDLS